MYKFLLFSLGFAIGLFLTSPVYAGTGPNSNQALESTFLTVDRIGATSSDFTVNFPSTSTYPELNNIGYAYGFLEGILMPNANTIQYWYSGNSHWLVGGSGSFPNSYTFYGVPISSGTLSFYLYPFGTGMNETISSTPPSIYGNALNNIATSSNWTSAYWDIDTLDLGTQSSTQYQEYYSVTSATPSFAYPIDGSTTADFPNWVVNLDNLDPYETYYIRILYTITQGTSTYNYYDDSSYVNDTSTSQSLVPIAKNHKLIPVMSAARTETSSVTAVAWIATDPSFSLFVINDSDPITFTVDYYATIPFTPEGQRAINGGVANPYDAELDASIAAGIQECGPAPEWTDFGGGIRWGLCSLIKFTLDPASLKAIDASKEIQISVNKLLHVYPFSIIYTVLENTNNQLESGASASSSDLYFSFNIANQTSSIRVAGPNFMVDTFGLPLTNLLFNGILIIFCLGALWTMYGLVIKLF